MGVLNKFEITYKNSAKEDASFIFQYNPSQLTINKSVNWNGLSVNGTNLQSKQFASGNAKTINISNILFDTTVMFDDTAKSEMNVYEEFIEYLEQMTLVQEFETELRPPLLTLSWGKGNYFFDCVLTTLNYDFTMFNKEGVPTRAIVNLTFEEIDIGNTTTTEKSRAAMQSYTIKSDDTLEKIAQSELGNSSKWKIIAIANGIDNPMDLTVGQQIQIPPQS